MLYTFGMFDLQKIQKWVEAINNYYAFGVLVYGVALYATSHSQLFWWVVGIATPLLTGWTGYLAKSAVEQRNQRHGFRVVSDAMTYEINSNKKYTLRYNTEVKAGVDHLMVYPIGYRWSGHGDEGLPKISGKGQRLMAGVKHLNKNGTATIAPYDASVSTDGDWHYWFIAINPPALKDDIIQIKYAQEFYDKKGQARTYVRYFVRVPMKRLELNVKFPSKVLPATIVGSYIKPSDPSRRFVASGVEYNPDRQWATWTIDKPKKGYCYQIHWE